MKGVILAAGKGTRLGKLTARRPKPMLPLANIPTLGWIIASLRQVGIHQILIVHGYLGQVIETCFGCGTDWGVELSYRYQSETTGTASAARLATSFVGEEPFVLCWGDILLEVPAYGHLLEVYHQGACAGVSTLNYVPDPTHGSAVYLEGERIVRMIEKPPAGTSTTHYNNTGAFVLPPQVFKAIDTIAPSQRGEFELTDAIQWLIDQGQVFLGCPLEGTVLDIGTPELYLEANHVLATWIAGGYPLPLADLKAVGKETRLVTEVQMVPPVVLGDHCRIAPAILQGPLVVGNNSVLARNAQVRQSVLMDHTRIGPGARVAYAILDDHAQIEANRTIEGTSAAVQIV